MAPPSAIRLARPGVNPIYTPCPSSDAFTLYTHKDWFRPYICSSIAPRGASLSIAEQMRGILVICRALAHCSFSLLIGSFCLCLLPPCLSSAVDVQTSIQLVGCGACPGASLSSGDGGCVLGVSSFTAGCAAARWFCAQAYDCGHLQCSKSCGQTGRSEHRREANRRYAKSERAQGPASVPATSIGNATRAWTGGAASRQ